MKKILLMIKYIFLIVIALGLIFYVYFNKNLDSNENFQNMVNKTFNYFSTNEDDYYKLNKEEYPEVIETKFDELILDIGGSFGDLDAGRMPWDTENKELSKEEALWGVVPLDATTALFKKIYLANQFDDISSLKNDEDAYYYQDPMFGFGSDNRELGEGMQKFEQALGYYMTFRQAFDAFDDLGKNLAKESLKGVKQAKVGPGVLKTVKLRLTNVVGKIQGKIVKFLEKNTSKVLQKGAVKLASRVAKTAPFKGFYFIAKALLKLKIVAKMTAKLIAFAAKHVFTNALLEGIFPPLGMFLSFIYDLIITPILFMLDGMITEAMDKWADSQGSCPTGTTALDVLLPAPGSMIFQMIPVIGDIFGFFYPYVCSDDRTGILVFKGQLQLPKYIDYAWLSCYFWKWPNYSGDYKPPRFQGKYLCTQIGKNNAGHCDRLNKKEGANPYDLYETVYFWGDNTDKNRDNILNLDPIYAAVTAIIRATTEGPPIYADNYYDFNDIIDLGNRDPSYSELNQINKKMVSMKAEYTTEYFLPTDVLPPNSKFFYADFSDPSMLVKMGQFYYTLAIANPVIDEDGFHNIQFISKINYVVASSLFTCDIECEMLNIKYNPRNGSSYNEFITLNHDRRFYYKVNYSNTAPYYWETVSNVSWAELDNRYDDAMYNLNEYLHRADIFDYKYVKDDIIASGAFIAAYEQIQNTGTIYSNLLASSNYRIEDSNALYTNYRTSQENYNILFTTIARVGGNTRERLDYRVSTLVGIKDELWTLQKNLNPVTSNPHPQYSLYGCTHIDDTAGAASPPDISEYQEDYRKRVNFDVLPYLERCRDKFINIDQCIDISNVEQVINKYKEKYPNKDIKSILNIKPQGSNVCQFTWNEVTTGQNDERKQTYNFLYQMDLSSCTFCLPNSLIEEGSSELPAIESIKMYKNPISDSNERIYNPDYATRLAYRKAFYFKPTLTYTGPTSNIKNVTFEKISNVDTILRYDPNTCEQLPDLVRPKKPIRITYPKPPETNLFKGSNDACSNPNTLNKFILDYNNTNPTNKILSIVRAFTSSSNSCDLEVDVLIKNSSNDNKVQRKTLSFNMKESEGFENIYTYDSLKNSNGLNVTKKTSYLEPPYNQKGVTYGTPYNNKFNPTVMSNISFFNNDLVTNYTTNTKGIVGNTRDLLVDLKGAQYLGNDSTYCRKKCDDPEIMQRIMEQYSVDNQAKGRFNQESDTMYAIFKSATDSANRCHIYFAQHKELYADKYAANLTNSNNYYDERLPALRRVAMKQLPGTCTFLPIAGQEYIDISASDLALQANTNESNFYYSSRDACTNLNCTNTTLLNQAILDYQSRSGSIVTRVLKAMKITNDTCDYNIIQDLNYEGDLVPDVESVLRVKYTYPYYNNSQPCGNFSYTVSSTYDAEYYKSDTFEVQFGGNLDDSDPNISPMLSYNSNSSASPSSLGNYLQNIT
uniref:Uncharacterized protein n=1 Tax=viral metagenome TaxID=1070528 RepID=A0A6C0D7S2_9ZZZZ